MGDPKKRRKQFSTPHKRWEETRIKEEGDLSREYGLANKREIWKSDSELRNFKRQAKRLLALKTEQAEKEKLQLIKKLKSLSLIGESASIDAILELSIKNILERRLQTLVFKKGIARSVKSARQFITHSHILVDGRKVTVPSYMVKKDEESKISFAVDSPFFSTEHPERAKENLPVKIKKKSSLKMVKPSRFKKGARK